MLKQSQCDGMAAAVYRDRLTVQEPSDNAIPAEDGYVDLTDDANWTTLGTIKVNFLTRGGREGRVFDQVQAEVSHIAETPSTNFSRAIHPVMRLVQGSTKYNIVAAFDVNNERKKVQIHLTEVV